MREILKNEIGFCNWRTTSDTETLVELLAAFGIEKTLPMLDGMFAFALYDSLLNKIWLARDRYGEKPLYWTISKDFAFASEMNALQSVLPVKRKISEKAKKQFFDQGFIAAPNTIFEEVFKLRAGVFCEFQITGENIALVDEVNWKKTPTKKNQEVPTNPRYLRDILVESVSARLISDVPVGVLLSGGIDSSLISAICKKELGKDITTFTVGFEKKELDEASLAGRFSKQLGLDHVRINADNKEMNEIFFDFIDAYSEPFADPSAIPSLILSKCVSSYRSVVLTGDGADEFFRGYDRYLSGYHFWLNHIKKVNHFHKPVKDITLWMSNFFFKLDKYKSHKNRIPLEKLARHLYKAYKITNAKTLKHYYEALVGETTEVFEETDAEERRLLQLADISFYLPECVLTKMDRASMRFSLETRTPYLNFDLEQCVQGLDESQLSKNKKGKIFLRDYLSELSPESYLTINRKKSGFTPSISQLIQLPIAIEYFEYSRNIDGLREVLEKISIAKSEVHADILKWRVICFSAWYKKFMIHA